MRAGRFAVAELARREFSGELPEGWRLVKLGDVAELQPGYAFKSSWFKSSGVRLLRGINIEPGATRWDDVVCLSNTQAEEFAAYRLDVGDLVLAMDRPVISSGLKLARIVTGDLPSLLLQRVGRFLTSPEVDAGFLHLFLRSTTFLDHIGALATGTQLPHISKTDIESAPLPLPPLDVQRRIVAKLDTLLAQTRAAREQLEAVPALVEKYRQSVLAAAFRGDLTAEWRKQHPDVEPIDLVLRRVVGTLPAPRMANKASRRLIAGRAALSVGAVDIAAPNTWRQVRLVDVARLESGHTPSRSHPEYWDEGIPWIGIRDAGANHGRTIQSTAQTVSRLGLENSAARLLPAGTVCLSRTASVGYSTVMGISMSTSQDFVNWVCSEAVVPKFLMYLFMAEGDHLLRFGEGSTHTTIYFPEVLSFHVVLPSVAEQHEIVRQVETAMSRVGALESLCHGALGDASAIGTSVLGEAFKGHLLK